MGMTKKQWEKREADILKYIDSYIKKNQYPPTTTDIAIHFGMYRQGVARIVDKLESQGKVTRKKGVPRTLKVI